MTAPTPAIAVDTFARSVVNAWGAADKGGPWSLEGTASNFAVSGGVGSVATPPGNIRTATLNGISSTGTDTRVDVAVNLPVSATYISVLGRHVGGKIQGITYSTDDVLRVRTQVVGTVPTTLRVKVWRAIDDEPATWNYQVADSTAVLQAPGSVGFLTYASSAAGGIPAAVKFSNFEVTQVAG